MSPRLRPLTSAGFLCLGLATIASGQETALEANRSELSPKDLAFWADWLRPSEEDAAWLEAISWQPSFAEGIRKANEDAKPLLLWVMNGHPLGCT